MQNVKQARIDRAVLVNGLNALPATETRASVLQKVVDGIVVIAVLALISSPEYRARFGQP